VLKHLDLHKTKPQFDAKAILLSHGLISVLNAIGFNWVARLHLRKPAGQHDDIVDERHTYFIHLQGRWKVNSYNVSSWDPIPIPCQLVNLLQIVKAEEMTELFNITDMPRIPT
jgi:hypothetical protein